MSTYLIQYLKASFLEKFLNPLVDRDTSKRWQIIRSLKAKLTEELGDDSSVFDEYTTRKLYSRDLAEIPSLIEKILFKTTPLLVVQPRTTEDLQKLTSFAQKNRVPLFPRGISSWGFGGSIPTINGIAVDFSPMDRIYPCDSRTMTLQVEAGARWGYLDQTLEPLGLALPVYPSNRFSTVGGWLSTGGLGLNSCKYGHIREWINAIEVITPAGDLATVRASDNEFDLFFGTEGQLGLISKVTLKLVKRPAHSFPHLLYLDRISSAIEFFNRLIEKDAVPSHATVMDKLLMHQMNKSWQKRRQQPEEKVENLLEEKYSFFVHFDDPQAESIFKELKNEFPYLTEAPAYISNFIWLERYSPLRVQILGPSLLASELILPLDKIAKFIEQVNLLGKRYQVYPFFEGHVVRRGKEYQLLIMVMFNCDRRKLLRYLIYLSLIPMVTRLGIKHEGKPYGIGIWNVPFFPSKFSPSEIRRLRHYKKKLDPQNILNPRKFMAIRSRFLNIPAAIFQPLFFNLSMDFLLLLSPVIGRLLRPIRLGFERREENFLEICSFECTGCGNCVAVCPAYRVTRHEGVTPRSKLRLARRVVRGGWVSKEESDRCFLCTLCGACEEVCQTELPLREAWKELEKILTQKHGRPEEKIREFIDGLGQNSAYLELIGSEPY